MTGLRSTSLAPHRTWDGVMDHATQLLGAWIDSARDYAIILVDPAGNVNSWNAGAERILGYSEDEILGRPIDLFSPGRIASTACRREPARARGNGRASDDRLACQEGRFPVLVQRGAHACGRRSRCAGGLRQGDVRSDRAEVAGGAPRSPDRGSAGGGPTPQRVPRDALARAAESPGCRS